MISAKEVDDIFQSCLWSDEEVSTLGESYLKSHSIIGHGITFSVGFSPEKIEHNRERIGQILEELDPQFFAGHGEGASFLVLPFTADDKQWGEHSNAEQLMLLGMAINKVKYTVADRTAWGAFAGSVPLISINLEGYGDS